MEIMPVKTEDAEELLSIYAPYVRDTAISFEYEVPSLADFQDRIRSVSSALPYIKAVEDGEILGYAYAGKFKNRKAYDWSVEVTVYVRKNSRRSGVGKLLYHALEDYMTTNISAKKFSRLAILMSDEKEDTRVSIDGTYGLDELDWQTFTPDKDSLQEAILQLFYEKEK